MKKFYRNKTDRFIAGVCGGLGQYFEIDSMIIRGLFVLFACMGGVGVVVYVVLAIIAPEEEEGLEVSPSISSSEEPAIQLETPPIGPRNKRRLFALFLFFLGLLMLLDSLLPFAWLNWRIFGPLTLMFLGGYIFILQK